VSSHPALSNDAGHLKATAPRRGFPAVHIDPSGYPGDYGAPQEGTTSSDFCLTVGSGDFRFNTGYRGLAEVFILGREFVGSDRCALILGDNLFFGHGLINHLRQAVRGEDGATGSYKVPTHNTGTAELDSEGWGALPQSSRLGLARIGPSRGLISITTRL
jgi:hypothetical protein